MRIDPLRTELVPATSGMAGDGPDFKTTLVGRRTTRAVGNMLYALDGEPALDLHQRHLGEEGASACRAPACRKRNGDELAVLVCCHLRPADQIARLLAAEVIRPAMSA